MALRGKWEGSALEFEPIRRPTMPPALWHIAACSQDFVSTKAVSTFGADRGLNGAPIHTQCINDYTQLGEIVFQLSPAS